MLLSSHPSLFDSLSALLAQMQHSDLSKAAAAGPGLGPGLGLAQGFWPIAAKEIFHISSEFGYTGEVAARLLNELGGAVEARNIDSALIVERVVVPLSAEIARAKS